MPLLNQLSASLAQQSSASSSMADLYKQKVGILCFQCGEFEFDHFPQTASWTYNFHLWPITDSENPYPIDWATEHNTEFVPMTPKSDVPLPGDDNNCSMLEDGDYPLCTVQQLIDAINYSESGVPNVYLMGFNQPYDTPTYVDATAAATLWGKYHMPIAKELGLKLVSPTVNNASRGIDWMATFLKACVDLADDETNPCDYTTLSRIALHSYHCDPAYITKKWSTGGKFQKALIQALDGYGGIDWTSFVEDTPYWVTATSCNWDGDKPNNVEQCLRITGQDPDYQQGGMNQWASMDNIERIAWWNVATGKQGQNAAASMMMNITTNELYPVGRAFANLFGEDTDCTSEPTNDLLSTAVDSDSDSD